MSVVTALVFTIPGPPVGKGRARFARRGKFVATYTPAKTVNYEALVKMAAQSVFDGTPSELPITMMIQAYFAIPKSMKKSLLDLANKEKLQVTKKPDADNIGKIVCDALNGIIYHDDAQVADLRTIKRYSPIPRVVVTIYNRGDLE